MLPLSRWLLVLLSIAWQHVSAQVNVDVIGPWPEYCDSDIVETGTHLYHQVSADAFWTFLDRMALVKDFPLEVPTGLLTGFGLLEGKDQARLLRTAIQLRSHAIVADIYKTMLGKLKEKIIPKSDACKSFVQVGKKTACNVESVNELLTKLEEGKIKGLGNESVLNGFDRIWTRNLKDLPVVILWADPSDKEGLAMHQLLLEQAKAYKITYVYRYRIKNTGCELKKSDIHLKGFGASYEVKSGGIVHPVLKAKIAEATGLKDAQETFETEFDKEYSEIGIKTAKLVAKSKKPFETFQTLVCNLPAAIKSISKAIEVTEKDKTSLTEMQRSSFMFPNSDVVGVNGVLIEPGAFSLQGLASFASDYAKFYAGISGSIDTEIAEVMLKKSLGKKAPTFEVQSNSILYLNDLEKDEVYAKHASTLRSVLRYSESGFFDIKRNLMTAVVSLDVGAGEAAYKVLNKLMKGWVHRGAPIRFGLLLGNYRDKDEFRLAIIATLAIEKVYSSKAALTFLALVL